MPPVTNMCQYKGSMPCFCNIYWNLDFLDLLCMNFSHKIIPYAHLIVTKGSRVIDDGMKGRKTLQKRFKDIKIEIITAFEQVAEHF